MVGLFYITISMINLRDKRYQEKLQLIEENVLKFISDYDIFNHYIPNFKINELIKSPLRVDPNPSFIIFPSTKYNNRLIYYDHGSADTGTFPMFLRQKYNLSYIEAISLVVNDFSLQDYFNKTTNTGKLVNKNPIIHDKSFVDNIKKQHKEIRISSREWNSGDKEYWSQYGISKKTLIKYNVVPIRYFSINNKIIKADRLAYAFIEKKKGLVRYKIYQPISLRMKWLNNFLSNTLSGYSQLPEYGDLLIISSSLKDGMLLHDIGYNFISPQSESYTFKPELMDELKSRFKEIVVFYDNDEKGVEKSISLEKTFELKWVNTNSIFKDPSDMYKYEGRVKTVKHIKRIINGAILS